LLGRDPLTQPLTALEFAVFALLVEEQSISRARRGRCAFG
jgi:hypothetical protein